MCAETSGLTEGNKRFNKLLMESLGVTNGSSWACMGRQAIHNNANAAISFLILYLYQIKPLFFNSSAAISNSAYHSSPNFLINGSFRNL